MAPMMMADFILKVEDEELMRRGVVVLVLLIGMLGDVLRMNISERWILVTYVSLRLYLGCRFGTSAKRVGHCLSKSTMLVLSILVLS